MTQLQPCSPLEELSHSYRFRAECQVDVDELRRLLGLQVEKITMIQNPPFPDMDVELETKLSLDALRSIMLQVVDGHVMAETVAKKEDYTGERTYTGIGQGRRL